MEEKPATMKSWLQLVGFVVSVTVIAWLVVAGFSYVFGSTGGGP
jgi:hypothetical protein